MQRRTVGTGIHVANEMKKASPEDYVQHGISF